MPVFKSNLKKTYKDLKFKPFRFRPLFSHFNEFFAYSERERFLFKAMDYLRSNKIEGDYLEFGVSEGNTFISSYHIAQTMGKNLKAMRFIGFDSFEGIPPVKNKLDNEGFKHFNEGDYAFPYKSFVRRLEKSKVNMNKVHLVKGWYDKTLNIETKKKLKIEKAALVYIDSDLYESAVFVLDFVNDLLQNGAILVFDDWFCFRGDPNRGEQLAFKEWLTKNPKFESIEFQKFGWYGNSFIVRLKEKKAKKLKKGIEIAKI